MTDARKRHRQAQKRLVAECELAMPDPLTPLWETIKHAPNVAFEPVAEALQASFPREQRRMEALLRWYGHGDGSCPVCWMFVGKLVFTFPDPVALLTDAVESARPVLLNGACLFLISQLEPRHARQAGVSLQRLESIRVSARGLPEAVKAHLVGHWTGQGGSEGDFAF